MRRSPLARKMPLERQSRMNRAGPLRPVSARQAAKHRRRRAVIQALYPSRPLCSVPWCADWADDVHEPLTRGRGGRIDDPANMAPLCRPHHDEITFTEPAWAYPLGLLRHSWDGAR